MSFVDALLRKVIKIGGVALPERKNVNFVSGATAVDNPDTEATDITVTSPGGGDPPVATDVKKSGGAGTAIDTIKGLNGGVAFTALDGTAAADGAAPPDGGAWVAATMRGSTTKLFPLHPLPSGMKDPRHRGAVGDGESHPLSGYFGSLAAAQVIYPHATSLTNEIDWAAIQSCVNSQSVALDLDNGAQLMGGTVYIGEGYFICDQPIACKQTVGLNLVGSGGISTPGTIRNSRSVIQYSGTGKRFIDARSSRGFTMASLTVKYSSTSFHGRLVDLSHSIGVDTSTATFWNCTFTGHTSIAIALGQGCQALIYMKGAINCTIDTCYFSVAHRGIQFQDFFGNYSNAHTVLNCQFVYLLKALCNAGQNVHVHGCTIEGSGGVMTAAYQDDYPTSRADGTDTFTFSATGASIVRNGPGSFITDGWKVGMQPILLSSVNNAFNGVPSYVSRVTATELSFNQVTLTFTGNTITRNFGSFVEDGWAIGMVPVVFGGPGGAVTNGDQTAITNVTASTITMAGTTYAGSTTSNSALLYHFEAGEFEYDAYTYGTPGWTWVTPSDVSTDARLILKGAGGPISFTKNWLGDQFLSTAWFKLMACTAFSLRDNFISGNDRVLDVMFDTKGLTIDGNYIQCPSTPFNLSTEGDAANGGIDGLVVKGNSGTEAVVTWPDSIFDGGAEIKNIDVTPNVGANDFLNTAIDATIGRFIRWVNVTASGKTITLPAKPYNGELHTIKVTGSFTADVAGNGHTIDGLSTLTVGNAVTVRYSQALATWKVVSEAAGGVAVAVSAMEIDWSKGEVFTKTLAAGANTFTFANAGARRVIIVRVTGAVSSLTWPTVKWPGGTPPTQTSSGTDVYTFVHDGTDVYGAFVQDSS